MAFIVGLFVIIVLVSILVNLSHQRYTGPGTAADFRNHDKTDIYPAGGRHVAHIERKLITLHEIHYVDMANGKSFVLSNEILHIIRDVTNIEGLGWILEGNFLQLNFTIKDAHRRLIAVVSQKAFSIHDKYAADIYMPEYEEEVVAVLITLQHMVRDRQAAAGVAGGGGGSASS